MLQAIYIIKLLHFQIKIKAKAVANFRKAARFGSINAKFNLGILYLSQEKLVIPGEEIYFSFSEAYQLFREAAEKGHTLAAYNIAIMHYSGIGTY